MWNARVCGKVEANIWARSRLGEITSDVSSVCGRDSMSISLLLQRRRRIRRHGFAQIAQLWNGIRQRLDWHYGEWLLIARVVRRDRLRRHQHHQFGLRFPPVAALEK